MKKTLLVPKELDLTSEQRARLKYEEGFYKLTIRFDLEIEHKINYLIEQFGDAKTALTHAVNHAYLGSRTTGKTNHELESENKLLQFQIDKLKAEVAALKKQQSTPTAKEERVNQALEELEATAPRIDLDQVFDHPFFDSELVQGQIG